MRRNENPANCNIEKEKLAVAEFKKTYSYK